MNYDSLLELKERLIKNRNKISNIAYQSFEKSFDIEYTHNSTAIEGNTLSLIETKLILEDKISVGGKSLREIYEVTNHSKAFNYLKSCVLEKKPLTEIIVKDIHAILMENILTGGVYRSCEVRITGASHKPPPPTKMYIEIKGFYNAINCDMRINSIELAAYTHAEFVRIHPFEDGNGRTSRLLMNYQLMANGFLPVSISKENRLSYFEALEEYAVNKNLVPFADMIALLEEEKLKERLLLID